MPETRQTKPKPAAPGVLPSRPDPAARIAERVRKALEPKSPLDRLAEAAKKIGRPTDHPRKKR